MTGCTNGLGVKHFRFKSRPCRHVVLRLNLVTRHHERNPEQLAKAVSWSGAVALAQCYCRLPWSHGPMSPHSHLQEQLQRHQLMLGSAARLPGAPGRSCCLRQDLPLFSCSIVPETIALQKQTSYLGADGAGYHLGGSNTRFMLVVEVYEEDPLLGKCPSQTPSHIAPGNNAAVVQDSRKSAGSRCNLLHVPQLLPHHAAISAAIRLWVF